MKIDVAAVQLAVLGVPAVGRGPSPEGGPLQFPTAPGGPVLKIGSGNGFMTPHRRSL